jgi:hypothetical protein
MPGYKSSRGPVDGLLTAMNGRLRFDAVTMEIVHFECTLTRDVTDPFLRFPKGTRFEIDLTKAVDQHYFPVRSFVGARRGKSGETDETTTEYSNFRLFKSESKIEFGDPNEPY